MSFSSVKYLRVITRIFVVKFLRSTSSIAENLKATSSNYLSSLESGTLSIESHCILQVQLYEDFAKSQVKRGLEESVSHIDDDENEKKRSKDTPHIFQVGFPFHPQALNMRCL